MVQMFVRDLKMELYGGSALECLLWRGFVTRDSLGILPGQNFLSNLGGVRFRGSRFREVPL